MLTVYQCWTGRVGGTGYMTPRIWGKLGWYDGVKESFTPQATSRKPKPTILSESNVQSLESSLIFDAMGRRVLNPRSGIFFVREEPQASSHKLQAVRKVVITR